MNSARKSVAANFLGQIWAALMGICFVPLYLKFIGVEGYGLIGLFVILSAAMTMLDGGAVRWRLQRLQYMRRLRRLKN